MRFNFYDAREVSAERLKEIVLKMIPKVDEKYINPNNSVQLNSPNMSFVEKTVLYKKEEKLGKEELLKIDNDKKVIENIIIAVNIKKALVEQATLSIIMLQIQKERTEKNLELLKDFIVRESNEKRRVEQAQLEQLMQLQAQALQDAINEKNKRAEELYRLLDHSNHLQSSMDQLHKNIEISRENRTHAIANHLSEIEVDGEKVFKDVPQHAREEYARTLLQLHEQEHREIMELRREYAKNPPTGSGVMFGYNKHSGEHALNKEIDRVKRNYVHLGKETTRDFCAKQNIKADPDKVHAAVENSKPIQQDMDRHKNFVAVALNQISDMKDEKEKVDNKVAGRMEEYQELKKNIKQDIAEIEQVNIEENAMQDQIQDVLAENIETQNEYIHEEQQDILEKKQDSILAQEIIGREEIVEAQNEALMEFDSEMFGDFFDKLDSDDPDRDELSEIVADSASNDENTESNDFELEREFEPLISENEEPKQESTSRHRM